MTATVIVNLKSSRAERHFEQIPELFSSRGIGVDEILTVEDNRTLRKRVKRAVKRGAKLVVVGGGDGSMTMAANALAHREAELGVLPLGTGNSFAQTLGIDGEDLEAALDVIAGGRVASVDLGVVNGTYFANFATIGFPAEVAAAASHDLKRLIGPAAYVVGAVKPFLTHGAFRAKVRWDDGRMNFSTHQMIVANGRFFGRRALLPNATITDGKLAFFTTTGVSHLDIARTYVALALGTQTHLPNAQMFYAEEIVVRARPKQAINIDGDALDTTPARFRIAPRALKVRVPATFVDERR